MSASSILLVLQNLWNILLAGYSRIIATLEIPLEFNSFAWNILEWLSNLFPDAEWIDWLLSYMPNVTITVGALMFGAGLSFIIVLRVITLLLDVLP